MYMRDVEGFTGSYLSGLGGHPTTLADPLIGAFLTVWQAEEAEHARAIGRYLDAYGAVTGHSVAEAPPPPEPQVMWYQLGLSHLRGPVGGVVCTAHMVWGATNELLTMNGYRLLADQSADPTLVELLQRIAAQEARHFSFYLLQAEWRLAASPLARALVPRFLSTSWTPVGVGDGYKTTAEFNRVRDTLRTRPGAERLIDRMDRRIAALPGFDQLRIYRHAMRSAAA